MKSYFGFKGQKDIHLALKYFSDEGNATKHSKIKGTFNEGQLINNFKTIEELLIKLVENMSESEG